MPDYLKIAEDFVEKGMYASAIEFAQKGLDAGVDTSKGMEILGIAYFKAKKISLSIEYFNKSLVVNPKNANAYFNLGLVYVYSAEWDKALIQTNLALQLDKNNCNYLYQLALIYKKTGRIVEALEVCSEILDAFPGDQSTLNLRSGIYLKRKEFKSAINDYEKLDTKRYDKATIYNNIGFCYSNLGELGKAKTYLQFALEFNASMAYANNNLGFVYFQEKNYEQALRYINESLEIDSSNSYALKNRAKVLIALNKIDDAIEDLKLAKDLGYSKFYDNEVDALLEQYQTN